MAQNEKVTRKYQIFISSTFQDLGEYRKSAILGITKAGHMPVALENFTPSTDTKKNVIRETLNSCQFYVIILGARYGSVAKDDPRGRGYVEIELDIAISNKCRILAFVMDQNKVLEFRKTDEFLKSDELRNVSKYESLKEKLTEGIENIFYKPFDSPEDVENGLHAYFSREHTVPGYILEQSTNDAEILKMYARNEVLRDVFQRLTQFETVEPRLLDDAQKKEALGKAFADLYGDHIRDKYKRVFLESGSTITYVAKALVNYLPHSAQGDVPTEVITNNAFAYLYLWLNSEVFCRPVPSGPPDGKYGGMYGEIKGRSRIPTYDMSPLEHYDPDAIEMIIHLSKETFGEDGGKATLLLAAISGIQLTNQIDSVNHNGDLIEQDSPLNEQLSRCRGFHVGSYENRLFKRSYYLTGYPSIVFVHDEKIDSKIVVGKCHFLCDSGYPWGKFIEEYPLSIWVACTNGTLQNISSKFINEFRGVGDWQFGVYGRGTPYPILIGRNASFEESCKNVNITLPLLPSALE